MLAKIMVGFGLHLWLQVAEVGALKLNCDVLMTKQ